MLDPYLRDLERLIWQTAEEVWGPQIHQRRALRAAIQELSTRYNDPGRLGGVGPDAGRTDLARLVFFTLADLSKIAYPVRELGHGPAGIQGDAAPARDLRVLDLGAGFGAQTLGLIGLLDGPGSARTLQIDAVDQDHAALGVLERLVARCPAATGHGANTRLRIQARRIAPGALDVGRIIGSGDPGGGGYDLIVAGSLLNELDPALHEPLARAALEGLAPGGHLILLEPALRHTTRALHALRDRLLAQGVAQIHWPCTHSGPCPTLDAPRDWCHERRSWTLPPRLHALSAETGLRRRDLKWSYVTLGRHAPAEARAGAYRVVSMPIKSKGKLELHLCGAEGWRRAVRLKRHAAPANAGFDQLDRGRLVRLDPAPETRSGPIQITAQTRVEQVDPAGGGPAG